MVKGIDRVAVFDRAQSLTLNRNEVVALAKVALQSLDRDRQLLSRCQECGGPKTFDNGTYFFDHADGCSVKTIEAIRRLPIEDGDAQKRGGH